MKTITTENGQVEYLNSGDWIENLTSLEYNNKEWTLYKYDAADFTKIDKQENEDELVLMEMKQYFIKCSAVFCKPMILLHLLILNNENIICRSRYRKWTHYTSY